MTTLSTILNLANRPLLQQFNISFAAGLTIGFAARGVGFNGIFSATIPLIDIFRGEMNFSKENAVEKAGYFTGYALANADKIYRMTSHYMGK